MGRSRETKKWMNLQTKLKEKKEIRINRHEDNFKLEKDTKNMKSLRYIKMEMKYGYDSGADTTEVKIDE